MRVGGRKVVGRDGYELKLVLVLPLIFFRENSISSEEGSVGNYGEKRRFVCGVCRFDFL